MEDHSQRILAASLGTKFLARRVQERSSTATSFLEQISSAGVRHVPREPEVTAREWESFKAEAAHDPELACMHRDGQCRKAVMWYVHHLPELTKEVIRDRASLPPRSFATCRMRSEHSRRRSLAQADTLSCTQPLVLTSQIRRKFLFSVPGIIVLPETFSTDSLNANIDMTTLPTVFERKDSMLIL